MIYLNKLYDSKDKAQKSTTTTNSECKVLRKYGIDTKMTLTLVIKVSSYDAATSYKIISQLFAVTDFFTFQSISARKKIAKKIAASWMKRSGIEQSCNRDINCKTRRCTLWESGDTHLAVLGLTRDKIFIIETLYHHSLIEKGQPNINSLTILTAWRRRRTLKLTICL